MLAVRRGRLLVVAVAVTLLTGASVLFSGLAGATPNPPGNNGTIKVDDLPFDDAPNNEPHVGCVFQVDFYGFDEGDLFAKVSFVAHPPTADAKDQVLLEDTVFIGEDDNSGGGSEAGLDASETYTLDLTGIEPHPNQGVHVTLTIEADGSQGADKKSKVFWTTGCPPGSTTSSTTSTTGATSSSGTTSSSTTSSTSKKPTTTDKDSTSSTVGGASSSAPSSSVGGASSSGAAGGALPLTGTGLLPSLAAGLALLGLGAAATLGGSRRRRRT